jgi:hypothetical protein
VSHGAERQGQAMGYKAESKADLIDEYITVLNEDLRTNDRTAMERKRGSDCRDWEDKVFQYILSGKYEVAYHLFSDVYYIEGERNVYWLDTGSAILELLFRAYFREIQNGERVTFQTVSSLNEMAEMYLELKFLLRRFEYDLPEVLRDELDDFLKRFPISSTAIIEFVKVYIIEKEKVLNEVAVWCFFRKRYEFVMPLLLAAYDENPQGEETLYNLIYFLYVFNEREMALELMDTIREKPQEFLELEDIIANNKKLQPYNVMHKMVWEVDYKIPAISVPETTETISFITCVNDERSYEECCYYIDHLIVPEGYKIEKIPIYDAESMTSGYQKGMRSSDAKYKIYLHQDVMCLNPYLLYEAVQMFERDSDIGMMGVAGCVTMAESGVWWQGTDQTYYNLVGDLVTVSGYSVEWKDETLYNSLGYQEVEVLDGVFLMTVKDLNWREDLFTGWHFYDISQSMEFRRKGYKVVIPQPNRLWVLHSDDTGGDLGNDYQQARILFLEEYKEDMIANAKNGEE